MPDPLHDAVVAFVTACPNEQQRLCLQELASHLRSITNRRGARVPNPTACAEICLAVFYVLLKHDVNFDWLALLQSMSSAVKDEVENGYWEVTVL
jgi:hypothetical protein